MSSEQTVFDYLRWRGDLSFAADAVNEVDCAILSAAAYLDFSQTPDMAPLSEAAATVRVQADCSQAQLRRLELLRKAAATPRFGALRVCRYREQCDETTQFAAVSFLSSQLLVMAFRGTDHSLIGWKEDCMLTYEQSIPAQHEAAAYAAQGCKAFPALPLVLTGHSKGGNLAIWAAASLPCKKNLLAVFSNDSPGFHAEFFRTEGYLAIQSRVCKLLPQASIVGTLLQDDGDSQLISSTRQAVAQHDLLSWEVEGKRFCRQTDRTGFGKRSDAAIGAWLDSMDQQERRELTETLFDVLQAPEKESLLHSAAFMSGLTSMLRTYADMDKERRQVLKRALRELAVQARQKGLRRSSTEPPNDDVQNDDGHSDGITPPDGEA